MPNVRTTDLEDRIETWWWWFAMALVLLVPLDLLTTILAVAEHGFVVEANPVTLWLLQRGLLELTIVNLSVAVLAVYLFDGAIGVVRRTARPDRDWLERVFDIWVAGAFAIGVVLNTNNVLAIV